MDEQTFIQKLEELAAAFPGQLEEYERGTWVENQLLNFKNRTGSVWDEREAVRVISVTRHFLESAARRPSR